MMEAVHALLRYNLDNFLVGGSGDVG
jgi:hypothetical protein